MKNQYFGDYIDFYRYGLLRFLANYGKNSLKTGICWMLTEMENKGQGMNVSYLQSPGIYEDCDPELYEYFKKTVPVKLKLEIRKEKNDEKRMQLIRELIAETNVSLIDNNPIMPNCVYNTRNENGTFDYLTARDRSGYLKRFKKLSDSERCDLLFFDSDIGILVKNHSRLEKYISLQEIQIFFEKSLLIFQYSFFNLLQGRPGKAIVSNLNQLKTNLKLDDLHLFKTPHVMFILAIHPSHHEILHERLEEYLESIWHTSGTMIYEEY